MIKLYNSNYQINYKQPCLKNVTSNQAQNKAPSFGVRVKSNIELPSAIDQLFSNHSDVIIASAQVKVKFPHLVPVKAKAKVKAKALTPTKAKAPTKAPTKAKAPAVLTNPDGSFVVRKQGAPQSLNNFYADILVEPKVVINGDYYAKNRIDFQGVLSPSGTLTAENAIFVESPKVSGKIKSHKSKIDLNADSFNGLVLQGKDIFIRSESMLPMNQAFVQATGDVHVFCPLDCSMISGRNVILHPGATLKNTRINAKEIFHLNSRLEKGNVVNAGTVVHGEESYVDESSKIIKEDPTVIKAYP